MDFMFDLDTLLRSLCRALDASSFRRAEVENALYNAHLKLFYDPAMCTDEEFRSGLRAAAPIVKQQLARKNGDATPLVGLIGHSHMDTAWLWPISETNKKCARTYANELRNPDGRISRVSLCTVLGVSQRYNPPPVSRTVQPHSKRRWLRAGMNPTAACGWSATAT